MPAVSPLGVLLVATQAAVGAQVSRSLPDRDRVRRVALGIATATLALLAVFSFGVLAAGTVDLVALLVAASAGEPSGRRPTAG